jgi:hypothetical protein
LSEVDIVRLSPKQLQRLRSQILSYYFTIVVICFIAIGILVGYCISLGTLVGPGVEESLGLALALLFLIAALLVHTVDRAYREWPLGRSIHVATPRVLTDVDVAFALRIVVIAGIAAAIAYILATQVFS